MSRRLLNFRVSPDLHDDIQNWLRLNPGVSFTDLANSALQEYLRGHHFIQRKPLDQEELQLPPCKTEFPAVGNDSPTIKRAVRNSVECWISAQTQQGICTLLLNKVRKKHPEETYWQPITGGIEEDESPHEACVREVFEETGIFLTKHEIRMLPSPWEVPIDGENRIIRKHIFWAVLRNGRHPVRLSDEHIGFNWTQVSAVRSALKWPTDKERWDHIAALLTKSAAIETLA